MGHQVFCLVDMALFDELSIHASEAHWFIMHMCIYFVWEMACDAI